MQSFAGLNRGGAFLFNFCTYHQSIFGKYLHNRELKNEKKRYQLNIIGCFHWQKLVISLLLSFCVRMEANIPHKQQQQQPNIFFRFFSQRAKNVFSFIINFYELNNILEEKVELFFYFMND